MSMHCTNGGSKVVRFRIIARGLFMLFMLSILTAGFKVEAVRADGLPAGAWQFVIFGDTRGDFDPAKMPPYDLSTQTGVSLDLPRIAAKIASLNPDFALHVGDLTLGDLIRTTSQMGFPGLIDIPYAQQFQAAKVALQPITDKGIPIYTVRGNHEVSCGDGIDGHPDPTLAAAYYQAFGG